MLLRLKFKIKSVVFKERLVQTKQMDYDRMVSIYILNVNLSRSMTIDHKRIFSRIFFTVIVEMTFKKWIFCI